MPGIRTISSGGAIFMLLLYHGLIEGLDVVGVRLSLPVSMEVRPGTLLVILISQVPGWPSEFTDPHPPVISRE